MKSMTTIYTMIEVFSVIRFTLNNGVRLNGTHNILHHLRSVLILIIAECTQLFVLKTYLVDLKIVDDWIHILL